MKWELQHIPWEHKSTLTVEWTDFDLLTLDLDAFDLALLRECDFEKSFADGLLALEMIARRIEQQTAKK